MKVLVTGGAGFIGSHIVDALATRGDDVVCLDSLDAGVHEGPPAYIRTDVDNIFEDLRCWDPGANIRDVEAVVHLAALGGVGRAAREPANLIDANCRGTARLVEKIRGWPRLKHVVLAGSFSVYGSNYTYECPFCAWCFNGARRAEDLAAGRWEVYCPDCGGEARVIPIAEDATPAPLEAYGASKYVQEQCFSGFDRCPVNVLRFSSVYGDRLRLDDGEATIIARMAGWIRAGRRPPLFEDGRQLRDWVWVGDIVDAALRIVDGAKAPPIVNVCSGIGTRLTEACRLIANAMNVTCEPEIVGGYRAGDMRHCLGDPSELRGLLGRAPVPFSEGAAMAFGQAPIREWLKTTPTMMATPA